MNSVHIHKDERFEVGGLLRHRTNEFSFHIEGGGVQVTFFTFSAKELLHLGHAIHDLGTEAMEMEDVADGTD